MKLCTICGKGSAIAGKRAFLRSHYNPTKTIRKYPNLQRAKLASGKSAKICTKCLKKLYSK